MATTFDLQVIFRAVDKLTMPINSMSAKLQDFSKRMSSVGNDLQNIGRNLTTFITVPITLMGIAAVKSANELEQQRVALETMLGSKEEAAKLLAQIRKFAAETPLETDDIIKASQTYLGFGGDVKKVMPIVKMLGDVTQGNKERFQQMALAFSQVSAAGKLTGQDLLQMINAGFNPLKYVAEDLGMSLMEVKEQMSKPGGKGLIVTTEMVIRAFQKATSEGGRYYNAMVNQSFTLSGRLSTLRDNVNMMAVSFGEALTPTVKDVVEKLIKFTDWLEKTAPETKKLIIDIAIALGVLGPAILAIGITVSAVGYMFATNPIGAIITGIALAIVGIIIVVKNWKTIWASINKILDKTPMILKILLVALMPLHMIPLLIVRNWGKIKKFFSDLWKSWKESPPIIKMLTPLITIPIMIIENWKDISTFFTELWDGIAKNFKLFWEILTLPVKVFWSGVIDIWNKSGIGEFLYGVWENFKKGFLAIWDFIITPIKKMWSDIVENPVIKWLFSKEQNNKTLGIKPTTVGDKNKVEVDIKVSSDKGTSAVINNKKTTGKTKAKVTSTNDYLGYSYPQ